MDRADTVGTLTALGHDTRLRVYRLLESTGGEGLKAGDIASAIAVAPPSLSNHLAILARAGLVTQERKGTSIIYRARPDRVKALARILVEG